MFYFGVVYGLNYAVSRESYKFT